ncbi:hypothetical protein IE985_18765 [Klebsiella pneumoniae]|nr:hypothetical protein [Klebsiella pneumoniae]
MLKWKSTMWVTLLIFLTLVIFAEVIYQQAGVKFVEADILTE